MVQKDLVFETGTASITEVGKEKQKDCVRVYCSMYPNVFTFQIRTCQPTKQGGVNKQMVASVSLSVEEMKKILGYMEDEKNA
jgi:hypothetical protein